MGNKLDKTHFVDYIYISLDWRVYVGNKYSESVAKCSSASDSVYAINAHDAVFQEVMAKKQRKVPTYQGISNIFLPFMGRVREGRRLNTVPPLPASPTRGEEIILLSTIRNV
ncbi:MAG: hypothetical protein UY73_C0017G0003 [Parcubacteria group bacterium GW2011_GWA2_52_8]|nr:MAG: hypothetical protein UY73_C0017G0003 [Parcubacteria group bacterium GW2011_GWA2_52_8]